jgi:hypothetical protein
VLSAVDALDVVAACPSRRPNHVELFLFCGGRFVEQRSLPRDRVWEPEFALETGRELLRQRGEAQDSGASAEVEPALLDQLFIIGRWLRRNSGEGRHFFLPADEEPNFLALRLGAWLREAAAEPMDEVAGTSNPTSAEAELIAEWADTGEPAAKWQEE